MIQIFSIFFFSIILFISCNNDETDLIDDQEINKEEEGYFEATINGKPWKSDSTYGRAIDNFLVISGFSDSNAVEIYFPNLEIGVRNLEDPIYHFKSAEYKFLHNLISSHTFYYKVHFDEIPGWASINSVDILNKTVSGEFEFKAIQRLENGELGKVDLILDGNFVDIPFKDDRFDNIDLGVTFNYNNGFWNDLVNKNYIYDGSNKPLIFEFEFYHTPASEKTEVFNIVIPTWDKLSRGKFVLQNDDAEVDWFSNFITDDQIDVFKSGSIEILSLDKDDSFFIACDIIVELETLGMLKFRFKLKAPK